MSRTESIRKRLIRFMLLGASAGSLMAIAVPPASAIAAEAGCVCNDSGAGAYQCNGGQTACIAGTQKCALSCQ